MDATQNAGGKAATAETSPDGLSPVQFEKSRRRETVSPGTFMRGFGKSGAFSLQVPSPVTERVIAFEGGKPVSRVAESCLSSPRILELRDRIIISSTKGLRGILTVDICFLEYVSAVLAINYILSDDDLTFLLAGRGWQDGMYRHLLGGDDLVSKLAVIGSDNRASTRIHPAHIVPSASPTPAPKMSPAIQPKPRRAWWKRFLTGM